jgi:hypothetical protein
MSKIILQRYQLNIQLICLKCQFYPSNERQENVKKKFLEMNSLCFKNCMKKAVFK